MYLRWWRLPAGWSGCGSLQADESCRRVGVMPRLIDRVPALARAYRPLQGLWGVAGTPAGRCPPGAVGAGVAVPWLQDSANSTFRRRRWRGPPVRRSWPPRYTDAGSRAQVQSLAPCWLSYAGGPGGGQPEPGRREQRALAMAIEWPWPAIDPQPNTATQRCCRGRTGQFGAGKNANRCWKMSGKRTVSPGRPSAGRADQAGRSAPEHLRRPELGKPPAPGQGPPKRRGADWLPTPGLATSHWAWCRAGNGAHDESRRRWSKSTTRSPACRFTSSPSA